MNGDVSKPNAVTPVHQTLYHPRRIWRPDMSRGFEIAVNESYTVNCATYLWPTCYLDRSTEDQLLAMLQQQKSWIGRVGELSDEVCIGHCDTSCSIHYDINFNFKKRNHIVYSICITFPCHFHG
jgi:hypothetical protein